MKILIHFLIFALPIAILFCVWFEKSTTASAEKMRNDGIEREKEWGVYGVEPVEVRRYSVIDSNAESITYLRRRIYLFEVGGRYIFSSRGGHCSAFATYFTLDSKSKEDAMTFLDRVCPTGNPVLSDTIRF